MVASPAWLAAMVQVPTLINVMVLTAFAPVPVVATVQTVVVVEVKATDRLDEAVAVS